MVRREKKPEKVKEKVKELAGSEDKVKGRTLTSDAQATGLANAKPQTGEGTEPLVKKKKRKKKKKGAAAQEEENEDEAFELAPEQPQVEERGEEKPGDKATPPVDEDKSEEKVSETTPLEVEKDSEKPGKQDKEDSVASVVKEENGKKGQEDVPVQGEEQDEEGLRARREKRLHICAFCGEAETIAKSYKRCQK